jgi:uncharacterized protein with PIN domain
MKPENYRLYANENFPVEVVTGLRLLGYDVLTTKDAGRAGQKIPDEDVLAFAISEKRSVLTINRWDFKRLHQVDQNHSGIVICTENLDFESFIKQIDAELCKQKDSIDGQLIRIYRPNI